ncbi:hypothetical protein Egran_02568 [Elaphomyces granulatus]|uniref:AmmeMemoRadiSam system protein B n=1 Tax=Elaphomyces granulatus TaxID=519963 RepID=A0A232M049_9EURO|nr:hypothetical protein Egran_02568 [Elaphomyces granulatus]
MPSRKASHAGSWYSANRSKLIQQLDQWLAAGQTDGLGSLPIPGARIIIAPHAGYDYSGPCSAFAYRTLDLSKAKRIFLLGPSHHFYLQTLALPSFTSYLTPLSDDPLPLDTELIAKLLSTKAPTQDSSTNSFRTISPVVDEAEHSLELHLPYIHRLLQLQHPEKSTSEYPPLVPIIVGSTTPATERAFGTILAPYLADPSNAFIISSDFCHWGLRFHYTYYVPHAVEQNPKLPLSCDSLPQPPTGTDAAQNIIKSVAEGKSLHRTTSIGRGEINIYDSISAVDIAVMKAITTGKVGKFLEAIDKTGNTVCGRHPIGVVMVALEELAANGNKEGKFHFVRYERSSDVEDVLDSSVSYVSAFAIL